VLQCNANVCPCRQPALMRSVIGANIDTLCPECCSCLLNLCHQFRMRLGYIVEGEDSPAELEEKVCAERDECPERELWIFSLYPAVVWTICLPQEQRPSGSSQGRK
jgi:hypothetical protein